MDVVTRVGVSQFFSPNASDAQAPRSCRRRRSRHSYLRGASDLPRVGIPRSFCRVREAIPRDLPFPQPGDGLARHFVTRFGATGRPGCRNAWSSSSSVLRNMPGSSRTSPPPPQSPRRQARGIKRRRLLGIGEGSRSRRNGTGGGERSFIPYSAPSPEDPSRHPFIVGLIQSLPRIGTVWPDAKREAWVATAHAAFNMIYERPLEDSMPRLDLEVSGRRARDEVVMKGRVPGCNPERILAEGRPPTGQQRREAGEWIPGPILRKALAVWRTVLGGFPERLAGQSVRFRRLPSFNCTRL